MALMGVLMKADDEAHVSERLEVASFWNSPTPVVVLSKDLTLSIVNYSARRLFGFEKHEVVDGFPPAHLGITVFDENSATGGKIFLEEFLKLWAQRRLAESHVGHHDVSDRNSALLHETESSNGSWDDDFWTNRTAYDSSVQTARVLIMRRDAARRPNGDLLPSRRKPLDASVKVKPFFHDSHESIMLCFDRPIRNTTTTDSSDTASISQSELRDLSTRIAGTALPEMLQRLKDNAFENLEKLSYFLTADESLFLPNKAVRDFLGPEHCERVGYDGRLFTSSLPVWDEQFTRRLPLSGNPGLRLVRNRKNYSGYRLGFIQQKTGDRIVCHIRGECIYDRLTGEFLGGLCTIDLLEDYVDRVAEEAFARSHETICNLLPHFVWTTKADGLADYFSERWYHDTGLSREESIGQGHQKAMHPDDVPTFLDCFATGIKTSREWECEVRYRRRDGIYRWMLARAAPLRDALTQKVRRWYVSGTDIHDLVSSRMREQCAKEQIVAILAHADVHLFALDHQGKLTLSEGSMKWRDMIHGGLVQTGLIGKSFFEILKSLGTAGGEDLKAIAAIRDILDDKVAFAIAEEKVQESHFRTSMIKDPTLFEGDSSHKHGVLGVSMDISHMIARAALKVENTRLQIEEHAAKEANRLKSQFLANMSHEIRTPLAGIIGMANLLGGSTHGLDIEQQECLDGILLSANTLLRIVNDILDFSKVESGRLTLEEIPINISVCVSELSRVLAYTAAQKQLQYKFVNKLSENLEVSGDPGRIRQVLSNLLTNSFKFTKHGTVKLSASSRSEGDMEIVQFVVEDSGIGMTPDVVKNLFRPFSQGDSSTARLYGGTGLGLAISRSLTDLMRGNIELVSESGKGTTVTITLPFKRQTQRRISNVSALSRDVETAILNVSKEQKRVTEVLIVEDNPINQKIALKTIARLGYPVTAVWNGQEAIDRLAATASTSSRPAIVLLDIQMPILDGYSATKIIRNGPWPKGWPNDLCDVPILAMTASAIQGDKEKCIAAGMDDYISKPVKPDDLDRILAKWTLLGSSTRRSGNATNKRTFSSALGS